MKTLKIFIFATIIPLIGLSQSTSILWQKKYYPTSTIGFPSYIEQTNDNGYILSYNNNGNYNILKLNETGDTLWKKEYGGSSMDLIYKVKQTNDGNYIAIGYTQSVDGDASEHNSHYDDFWYLKLDSLGNIIWNKCLNMAGRQNPKDVVETFDNGFVLAGYSWEADTLNGNFGGIGDFWILKISSNGDSLWSNHYGGSGNDYINSITQANNGDLVFIGYSTSSDYIMNENYGDFDSWIIRTDSIGNMIWKKHYGGSDRDIPNSINNTTDNGFIVVGESKSSDLDLSENYGGNDIWILKINSLGNIEWQKTIGGSGEDTGIDVKQTSDNGFIIGATSSNDYLIIKLDSLGNMIWSNNFGGSSDEKLNSINLTNDLSYIISGMSYSNDGDIASNYYGNGCWIIKLSNPNNIKEIYDNNKFVIYPNPTNGEFNIKLNTLLETEISIFSINGGKIFEKQFYQTNEIKINNLHLEKGVYFVKIKTDEFVKTKKLIIN